MSSRTSTFDKLMAIKHLLAYTDHLVEAYAFSPDLDTRQAIIATTQLRRDMMKTMLGDVKHHCRMKHILAAWMAAEEVAEADDSDLAFKSLQGISLLALQELEKYTGEKSQLCDRCKDETKTL